VSLTSDNQPHGVYLHVPLCRRRCNYCAFYSRTAQEGLAERVGLALISAAARTAPVRGRTLYVGGGTPNLLSAPLLMDLLARTAERFDLPTGAEKTIEANPAAHHDPGYLGALVRAGLTRLSVGFQSFDDAELRLLGRLHTADDTAIIANARRAGVRSLSLDLLYGLPDQGPRTFSASLRRAVELGVDHLSLYALKLEPGTPLARAVESGGLPVPDPDAAADCYAAARELLAAAGFQQYEISNFARPGHRSRHNEHYWRGGRFIGLGPSAVGDDGTVRRKVTPDLEAWLAAIEAGREPPVELEEPTPRQREIEFAMLNLRHLEGLSVRVFAERFGRDAFAAFPGLASHLEAGRLVLSGGALRLSPEHLLTSDAVLRDLFD
jgi:oxygen-independent coproporphyrinogen III oxidase